MYRDIPWVGPWQYRDGLYRCTTHHPGYTPPLPIPRTEPAMTGCSTEVNANAILSELRIVDHRFTIATTGSVLHVQLACRTSLKHARMCLVS